MLKVTLEEEGILERREIRVQQVWMASKVLLVPLGRKANQAHEVCLESQVLRVPRDLKDQEVRLVHLAPLVRKEKWVFLVSLAILAEEVPRGIEVWLANEEEMDLLVPPELLELMEIEVNQDQEDQEGREALEVFQVLWVQKERQDPLVPQVLLVPLVLRAIVVQVVTLVLLVHQEFQEKMV